MKKITAIMLIIAMILCCCSCGGEHTAVPAPQTQQTGETEQKEDPGKEAEPEHIEEMSLHFSRDQLPVIDGATAFLPFYQEMTARLLDTDVETAKQSILCSTTDYAYPNLTDGKADMVFCLHPSEDQVKEARDKGVYFEEVPFMNEAFVFFVNKDNPVDSITVKELGDIYAGRITNWKDLGGNDEEIIAYQRSEGSGSQTGLYAHVISQSKVAEPPKERRIGTMGEIIDAVASYDNAKGAIGFSYLYFVNNMHYDEQIKLLAVEGVAPDYEAVSAGTYPMISEVCAVFRDDEPSDSPVRQIAAWCTGTQGQALAKSLGYVGKYEGGYVPAVGEASSVINKIEYAEGNPVAKCDGSLTVTRNNLDVKYIDYGEAEDNIATYIQISGLKNKDVENSINSQILKTFEYYMEEDHLPPYVGVRSRTAMFDGEDSNYSFNCYSDVCGSFNNILSVVFNITRDYNNYNADEYSEDSDYLYIYDTHTLNFDLNTGKQIRLRDLFADNVDAMAYMNKAVEEALNDTDPFSEDIPWDGMNSLKLVSEFKGVREDQKYFINDHSGDVTLVFDYETPEFYSNFSSSEVIVSMKDVNAYNGRFTGADLYEDSTERLALLINDYDSLESENVSKYYNSEDLDTDRDLSVWVDYSYCDKMPENQKKLLIPEADVKDTLFVELNNSYDAWKDHVKELQGYASYNAYFSRYGDYTNIYSGKQYSLRNSSDWNTLVDISTTKVYCFEGDSDVPLGLNDIFRSDADMYDLIKKAMKMSLINSEDAGYVPKDFDELFEILMTNISGFAIYANSISITYDLDMEGLVNAYFDFPDYPWSISWLLEDINYSDLGCRNLTIFD